MDRVFHMVASGFPLRHDFDFSRYVGYFPSPNLARQVSPDLGSPGVPRNVNPHMGDTVQAWSAGVHLARQVRLDSGSDFQSVVGGGRAAAPASTRSGRRTHPRPSRCDRSREFAVGVPLPRARPVRRGAEAASSSSALLVRGLAGRRRIGVTLTRPEAEVASFCSFIHMVYVIKHCWRALCPTTSKGVS